MRYVIGLFIFCLLLISCKKENDNQLGMLTDKKWQVVYKTILYTDGHLTKDSINNWPAYIKDDYIIWHSNFTYAYNDNVQFHPSAQTYLIDTGSYIFSDGTIIGKSLYTGQENGAINIESISIDSLKYTFISKYDSAFYKIILIRMQ